MTDEIITTWVSYQQPSFYPMHEIVKAVETRNPQLQANQAPATAYGFFYFDTITTVISFEDEKLEISTGRFALSKTYYIDAEPMTPEKVEALPEDELERFLSNMSIYGADQMVRCRAGTFEPYNEREYELVTTS